jgi:hypothetical protein
MHVSGAGLTDSKPEPQQRLGLIKEADERKRSDWNSMPAAFAT